MSFFKRHYHAFFSPFFDLNVMSDHLTIRSSSHQFKNDVSKLMS